MARHTATTVQTRIIEHARSLFDLSWSQATGEDTINFDVVADDFDDLKTFMSLHDYEHWTTYRTKDSGELDVSFIKR